MITKLQWLAKHSGPLLVSLWLVGTTILAARQIHPKTLKDRIQILASLAFIIFIFVWSVDALLSFFVIMFFPKVHPLLQNLWFVAAMAVIEYSAQKEWAASSKYFEKRNPRLFHLRSKNKELMMIERIEFEAFIKFFGFILLNIVAAILLRLFRIFIQTI